MKKSVLYVFLALTALMAFIFSGCGSSDDDSELTDGNGNAVSGFAAMKEGSWKEMVNTNGSHHRIEFLGTDNYRGTDCYLMELDTTTNGKKETIQIWFSKSPGQGGLMVMKNANGEFTKMELTSSTQQTVPTGEVPATATKIGTDKYTTPTGKTVDVTKYKIMTTDGEAESWISSQVPFGDVKALFNGVVENWLYDYGTSDAVRDISNSEMENASSSGIGDGGDKG